MYAQSKDKVQTNGRKTIWIMFDSFFNAHGQSVVLKTNSSMQPLVVSNVGKNRQLVTNEPVEFEK
jgi:hypothetical protein